MFLKQDTVMGIDCSTNSLAFGLIQNNNLTKWGEIAFEGHDVYHRAADAKHKIEALQREFNVKYIAIEKTIRVRSIDTAIKMAFVAGTVISCLINSNNTVVEVAPITWQSAIGNPNLSIKEKNDIKLQFPDRSKSWYQNKGREIRKLRTIKWAEDKFGIIINSNNVSDAIGLAWYTWTKVGNL